jgi:hypothetical protein
MVGKGSRMPSANGLPSRGERLLVNENTTVFLERDEYRGSPFVELEVVH